MQREYRLVFLLCLGLGISIIFVCYETLPAYKVQVAKASVRRSEPVADHMTPSYKTASDGLRKPRADLGPEAKQVIRAQRDMIAQELADYPFQDNTLEGLLMDAGGSPLHSMVVTTWRSGSTFIADVLNSHPAMYYHYEPLMDFGIHRTRDGRVAEKAVGNLQRLMNCDYSQMGDYISFSRSHVYVFLHNVRLWRFCRGGRWPTCWQPAFLSQFCRLFPFQTTKTVRLPLAQTAPLLAGQPGLRVLLLVRDPRGTLQSRQHRTWCPSSPDCADPARLCRDLEDDYWAAQRLAGLYDTDRLRVVRYEDFSIHLSTSVPTLLKFAGVHYHPTVQNFVKTHTTFSKGGVSSTFRNSTTAPFKWVQKLSWPQVDAIQTKCAKAMQLWGYRTLTKDDWEIFSRNQTQPLSPAMFVDDIALGNLL